jgi:hypothetical protein
MAVILLGSALYQQTPIMKICMHHYWSVKRDLTHAPLQNYLPLKDNPMKRWVNRCQLSPPFANVIGHGVLRASMNNFGLIQNQVVGALVIAIVELS